MAESVAGVHIPVIAIDGPSGSGKGTVGQWVARQLGWNFLDSGALYRLLALAANGRALALDDEMELAQLALQLDVHFLSSHETGAAASETRIILEDQDVTDALRSETCGNAASRLAVLPQVRLALLERQRAFRLWPGLVADGRDMASVVFPDALLKIFLTASADERARRRYKQLKGKGLDVNISSLIEEIAERDARDSGRSVAPLQAAPGAILLDTSGLDVGEVVAQIIHSWRVTLLDHPLS